ncbi:MAG: hypothetical protein C0404_09730 [Verrucomicrobia bacterium]|nr:hypothetical protein [Verrucomicrobiota bacterium]
MCRLPKNDCSRGLVCGVWRQTSAKNSVLLVGEPQNIEPAFAQALRRGRQRIPNVEVPDTNRMKRPLLLVHAVLPEN